MGGMTQAVNSPANRKALIGAASFAVNLKRIVALLDDTILWFNVLLLIENESFDLFICKRLNCPSKDEATIEMFPYLPKFALPVAVGLMESDQYDALLATARRALGEQAFSATWAAHTALPVAQVVVYALQEAVTGVANPSP